MSRGKKRERRSDGKASVHLRAWPWVVCMLAVAGAVWALTGGRRPSVTRVAQMEYAPVTGPLTFPARVASAEPELRDLYEFAARRPDVLRYLPCYCGCGRVHRSNYDCFIDEVRADGTVLIDDMSFT